MSTAQAATSVRPPVDSGTYIGVSAMDDSDDDDMYGQVTIERQVHNTTRPLASCLLGAALTAIAILIILAALLFLPVARPRIVTTALQSLLPRPLPSDQWMNEVADPAHIEASDGRTYRIEQYKHGFLFPDKRATRASEDELAKLDRTLAQPLPPFRPYPPHEMPPLPRVDFIMRTFSGYTTLTSYLLRSLDLFVPWRWLGEVIVVLDDNTMDRQYALTLPSDVTVYFEEEPMWLADWSNTAESGGLGVERAKRGYGVGLYSNWLSDRYSNADYICILDPDMLFITKGSLPLMFDWDDAEQTYKPIWLCRDNPEPHFVPTSYKIYNLGDENAPGCMFQLPVCMHRDTLRHVRENVTAMFAAKDSASYSQFALDITVDRDSNFAAYKAQYDRRLRSEGEAGGLIRYNGTVPPSAFDRTYMHIVNWAGSVPVCQFCVWGSYIVTMPSELKRYTFHWMGGKRLPGQYQPVAGSIAPASSCPQLRAGTHAGYLVPLPKISPAYYRLGNELNQLGVCLASLPTDCNRPQCAAHTLGDFTYNAVEGPHSNNTLQRMRRVRWWKETGVRLLWAFEYSGVFQTKEHEERCGYYVLVQGHQLLEWVQTYDLARPEDRKKMCGVRAAAEVAGA